MTNIFFGFSREQEDVGDTRGFIDLYTTFGEERYLCKIINIRYLLVNANTSYNILLGRSSINPLQVIVSTPHLAWTVVGDIITAHVDKNTARACYVASLKVEATSRLYRTSSS